ncbi:lisH domain-containing protein-like protein, partial [Tanacetum coccineum]
MLLKQVVTSEPEYLFTKRESGDMSLILASDGLWDVLSSEMSCEVVYKCQQEDFESLAHRVVRGGALYSARTAMSVAAALLVRLAMQNKIEIYTNMSQADDIQRTLDNPKGKSVQNSFNFKSSKTRTSPTFQQLLQRDGSKWSHVSLQKMKKNSDQEDKGNSHNKMSVLAKIKDKAKRLKHSFSRKKHGDKNDSRCNSATRSSSVSLKEKGEEDADYHSARMSESKHAQVANTKALVSIPEKHLEKRNTEKSKDEPSSSSDTITDAQSKNQAPQNASIVASDTDTKNKAVATIDVSKVHELPERNSRFSSLTVSTSESVANRSDRIIEEGDNIKDESHKWDKGVSVKEYLMHKFEPGEDERALSKVIAETISPRRDKVREAMSSFLKNEEPSEMTSADVDNDVNLSLKSKSLPTSTILNTNTEPKKGCMKQSHSLGSNATKASSNLNQTFKSTFASYQVHFLSSSSSRNTNLNSSTTSSRPNTNPSTTKTSSSPFSHASRANEIQTPASSTAEQSQVSRRIATSVRRVPVNSAIKSQVPDHTDANETRSHVSTSDQDPSPGYYGVAGEDYEGPPVFDDDPHEEEIVSGDVGKGFISLRKKDLSEREDLEFLTEWSLQ